MLLNLLRYICVMCDYTDLKYCIRFECIYCSRIYC